MRRPLIPSALALLLFPACPAAESFSADLENDEDEVAWLLGSDSGLSISVQAEVDGTLQSLYPSAAWLCMPECGAPAGMVACAASEAAPMIETVLALLPGDQISTDLGDEFWYVEEGLFGSCARRFTGDTVQGEICRGSGAQDFNGDVVPEPSDSGTIEGATLVDPTCTVVELRAGDTLLTTSPL